MDTSIASSASGSQPVRRGAQKPISEDKPSELDLIQSEEVRTVLREHNSYESEEESNTRRAVLARLNEILRDWIHSVCIRQGHSQEFTEMVRGKLCTFGSYRLGVNGPGGDIDALCVAPRHVSHDDFFADVPSLLRAEANASDVQEVPESYVPVIKFMLMNISVDLIFVSLDYDSIPDSLNLVDESVLHHILGRERETTRDQSREEKFKRAVRCLNGCRVTDTILSLVPEQESFRTTLRFLKIWAKNRGIYGNVWGYFGGVTLAMLTTFMCQLYPCASPSFLISRFFRIQIKWPWPRPIIIQEPPEGPLNLKNWDKRRNRADLMPIITPCYPTMNSSYTVSKSTLHVIKDEIARGHRICDSATEGKTKWEQLLEPLKFFEQYNHFVEISMSAPTNEDLLKWTGHCISRLRDLVKAFQDEMLVELVHPYPKQFDSTDENGIPTSLVFFGLSFRKRRPGETAISRIDLSQSAIMFLANLDMWDHKTIGMKMHIRPVKRHQIAREIRGKPPKKGKKRKTPDDGAAPATSAPAPAANQPSGNEDVQITEGQA